MTEGALVSAAGATLLTTIEQLDPIHVVFTAPSTALLEHDRASRAGRLRAPRHCRATLLLPDGSRYERAGTIDFVDQSVDPDIGNFTLRARFPNPEQLLLPGQFVPVAVNGGPSPMRSPPGGRWPNNRRPRPTPSRPSSGW